MSVESIKGEKFELILALRLQIILENVDYHCLTVRFVPPLRSYSELKTSDAADKSFGIVSF